ncbi:MAG: DNA mismatch repair protein MutS [Planctomycetota bacterium]
MSDKPPQLDTPAMRQYRQFKAQYPDYLLLFRMGDFYEMFYEDAKTAARVLGLTLTSRSKGPAAVPLAGIPYHALDGYLAKLVAADIRVAICEQVEDPRQAKGLVERDVTRLVTPGTLTDPALLDQREGNFLAAVFGPWSGRGGDEPLTGLAWVELSGGTFRIMDVPAAGLTDELSRIRPAEVLLAEGGPLDTPELAAELRRALGTAPTTRPPWAFEARAATEALHRHFGVRTLAGFGLDGYTPALSAAGAVIDYLQETQKTALDHLRTLQPVDRTDYMILDGVTLRSLEIKRTLRTNQRSGSLLACVDTTRTGMGARLLEQWITFPLKRYSPIVARQDAIAELVAARPRAEAIAELLGQCAQIDRITTNIALGRVRPRELVHLGRTLELLPDLHALASELAGAELIARQCEPLPGLEEAAALIARAIDPDCPTVLRDGGVIADGYNEELDRLRRIGADGESWLARYQARQIQRTGIPSLRVGFNKVFGYYLEVTHAHADKVPADYTRKQTLKNAERYISDELKRYESEVLTAGERARTLEATLFEEVRQALCAHVPALQAAAEAVATLDVLTSLALLAVRRRWVRPTITQDNVLAIHDGRHPVLAEQLAEQFVPNDVTLGAEADRIMIITGPNMAGKSTYIRQNALLVLLAQTGSFIPAAEATVGLTDRIFTRVGAADELTAGLSTFMVEMVETANILNNATRRSLVILDEVGRGTSTYDGLALAWAVTEHLAAVLGCRTLFATHYHELTELAAALKPVKNLNVAVREWADEVVFLHKIVEGGTDRSYGVYVARLAGIPPAVLRRATDLLPRLQAHLAGGVGAPKLARDALRDQGQKSLFVDDAKAAAVGRRLRETNLESLTPLEALDLLRRLQREL